MSPINQLLVTLRYYATNSYLNTLGDFSGMDTATVCRIIDKVSRAIANLAPQYIKMQAAQNLHAEHLKFHEVARFPRVVGLIDGTHIKIMSPGKYNTHSYSSHTCQKSE